MATIKEAARIVTGDEPVAQEALDEFTTTTTEDALLAEARQAVQARAADLLIRSQRNDAVEFYSEAAAFARKHGTEFVPKRDRAVLVSLNLAHWLNFAGESCEYRTMDDAARRQHRATVIEFSTVLGAAMEMLRATAAGRALWTETLGFAFDAKRSGTGQPRESTTLVDSFLRTGRLLSVKYRPSDAELAIIAQAKIAKMSPAQAAKAAEQSASNVLADTMQASLAEAGIL